MKVSVVPCDSYDLPLAEEALRRVLEPLGGLDWVTEGMTVAIKANLVTFMKPEAAGTTHPVLLCALIKLLKEKGARVIVGDSPGGLYTKVYVERVYAATGLKAVEAAGGELNRDFTIAEALYPEAKEAKTFTYTAWLDKADAIIDFCKLKTHGMMAMSGAAKTCSASSPARQSRNITIVFPIPTVFPT